MQAMVTARVPVGVRDRGNEILAEIGSNPTQLVNAAYEFVIREHRLPCDLATDLKPGVRQITPQMSAELDELFARTTVKLPDDFWQGRSFKEILAEERAAEYEAIS